MGQSANKLFIAWAARHRDAVELELYIENSGDRSPADLARLKATLAAMQLEAQEMLEEAKAAFETELRGRGILP